MVLADCKFGLGIAWATEQKESPGVFSLSFRNSVVMTLWGHAY
jgi:hypothetical protein